MALTISLCSVVLKVSYIHNYSNEVWVLISGKRLCVGYHCYCLPEVEFLMSLYSAWNMKLQTLTKSKCLNLDKRTIILKVCHVLNLFYLWSNSQFFLKFVHWTLVKIQFGLTESHVYSPTHLVLTQVQQQKWRVCATLLRLCVQ